MSKWELEWTIKKLREVHTLKYDKKHAPKYPMESTFATLDEVDDFFNAFYLPKEYKLMLACRFAAFLGMRPQEIVQVQLNQINFFENTIVRYNCKNKENQKLPLNPMVLPYLKAWVEHNHRKIEASGGYIFFRDSLKWQRNQKVPKYFRESFAMRKEPFMSKNALRSHFRRVARRAGVLKVRAHDINGHRLNSFNMTSLRKFYCSYLSEHVDDVKVLQKLTGHKDINVLFNHYINRKFSKLEQASVKAWGK